MLNNAWIARALARDLGRHVFAVDLRNHGESPHHPRHDYSAMAEDVAEFIKYHGLKEPTLIGHSMCVLPHHPPLITLRLGSKRLTSQSIAT